MAVLALDHVQLAMPDGGDLSARAFYEGLLGLPQIARPDSLKDRPGCWFSNGAVNIHMGVEADFRAAKKAHPALVVDDLAGLAKRLTDAGAPIRPDVPANGFERLHTEDPFGNRIELMQKI